MASDAEPASADLAKVVGTRVRSLRQRRAAPRNTLAWLSEETGMSVSFLSMIENGRRLPSLPALAALAEALGTPVAELVGSEPSPQKLLEPIVRLFRERRLGRREAGLLLAVARKMHP